MPAAPNHRQKCRAQAAIEDVHADGRVGAGDQDEDHGVIDALEAHPRSRLPASSVIQRADAEQSGDGKPVYGERRPVLRSGDEDEGHAEGERDHEGAEMKQPPEKRPRQTVRQQVRIGHWAEAPRAAPARIGPA